METEGFKSDSPKYFDESTASPEHILKHIEYLARRRNESLRHSPDDARDFEQEIVRLEQLLEEKRNAA